MKVHVVAAFTVALFFVVAGCSKEVLRQDVPETIMAEPEPAEGRLNIPAESISLIPLEHEGVITDMKGQAFLVNRKSNGYRSLEIGDKIPFDRILNTKPRTIIELTLPTGENAFIYSQEKESWFKIEETKK